MTTKRKSDTHECTPILISRYSNSFLDQRHPCAKELYNHDCTIKKKTTLHSLNLKFIFSDQSC